MSESERYYKTLALDPGASREDVKHAYREMAKAWHPDRYPYSPELRKRCEEKMRRINEAYEYLRRHAPEGTKAKKHKAHPAPPWPGPPPERPPEPPPKARPKPPPEEEPAQDAATHEPWLEPYKDGFRKRRGGSRWSFPWRRRVHRPDFSGLTQVGIGFGASILILGAGLFADFRSEAAKEYFETLSRTVVFLSGLFGAFFALSKRYMEFAFCLILIAMLFNPLFPFRMTTSDWRVCGIALPLALAYFWTAMFNRESRKN